MSDLHQRAEDIAARLEEHDPETCPSQDEASAVIYELLDRSRALENAEIEFATIRDLVLARWPDGFCVALPGAQMVEDPYFRTELIEMVEEIRVRYEARDSAQKVSKLAGASTADTASAVQGAAGAAAGSPQRPGDSQ